MRHERNVRLKALLAGLRWIFSNFIDSFTKFWYSNYLLPCVWSNQFGACILCMLLCKAIDSLIRVYVPMYWKYFRFYPIRLVTLKKLRNADGFSYHFICCRQNRKLPSHLFIIKSNIFAKLESEFKICKMYLVNCAHKTDKS